MKSRQSASGFRKRSGGHRHGGKHRDDGMIRIYGVHASEAALTNPRRMVRRIYATPNAAQRLGSLGRAGLPEIATVTPKDLDRMLGEDTVHQGILIEAEPLAELSLADLPKARLIVFLDQLTDPHNVGAILRSAAAFDADALVMTARHSPPLEGTLAKAASGGLEHVPILLVPNLARALAEAGEIGFLRLGLDSEGDASLGEVAGADRIALVLGAEDRGLRRLTREHCDAVCALTTFGPIASLNVSNAAAIALYVMAQKMRNRPAV
jgi:23S rRNA (guanosine2251-2'-O)-methyltransferase